MTQAYTAKLVQPNGRELDVTDETTFSMHDPAYGTFAGATLTVSGQGSGPTRVEASAQGATGDAGLIVFVRKTVVEAGGPQIWMTPVFPARAAAGQDPSGNAFRVPFQDVGTSNHIAQWTQAVVVQ